MQRVNKTLTADIERRILLWMCARLPRRITSDMLTTLGVAGAMIACAGFALSRLSVAFLSLALVGIALNWLGDSLDGSLARHRGTERPKYGFFLDHMTDTLAIGLIAVGIGLSPYAQFASGLAVLLGYYAMVILSMATCIATGVFRISFGRIGPTEIRLFIMACTIPGMFVPTPRFETFGAIFSIYDLIIFAVTAVLLLTCLMESAKTLRQLALADPPHG